MDNLQPASVHPRQSPRRVWAVLGALLSVLLGCIAVFAVIPSVRPTGFDPYPSTAMITPLALIAGYGITLPFACLWANQSHWRAMLRLKWGRAISAFLFAGFFPIGLWGSIPTALGFFPALVLLDAFNPAVTLRKVVFSQSVIIAATLLLYPLSCAMIYGLPMRQRIPAFLATISGGIAFLFLMGLRTTGTL